MNWPSFVRLFTRKNAHQIVIERDDVTRLDWSQRAWDVRRHVQRRDVVPRDRWECDCDPFTLVSILGNRAGFEEFEHSRPQLHAAPLELAHRTLCQEETAANQEQLKKTHRYKIAIVDHFLLNVRRSDKKRELKVKFIMLLIPYFLWAYLNKFSMT